MLGCAESDTDYYTIANVHSYLRTLFSFSPFLSRGARIEYIFRGTNVDCKSYFPDHSSWIRTDA